MDHALAYDATINFGQVISILAQVVTILGLIVTAAAGWASLKNKVDHLGESVTNLKEDTNRNLSAIKEEITELRKTTVALAGVTSQLQSHADLIRTIQVQLGELQREISFPFKPSRSCQE